MTAWCLSYRTDPSARPLADRHYNRQHVGATGFVPPGRCLVLLADDESALWVTSWPFAEYVKHDWPGAWINSTFRNEGKRLSSDLIREAVAMSRWRWPTVPALGMVTFIDEKKVKPKRDPGYCYLQAGFVVAGRTKGGLLALQMWPDVMPEPLAPLPRAGQMIAI